MSSSSHTTGESSASSSGQHKRMSHSASTGSNNDGGRYDYYRKTPHHRRSDLFPADESPQPSEYEICCGRQYQDSPNLRSYSRRKQRAKPKASGRGGDGGISAAASAAGDDVPFDEGPMRREENSPASSRDKSRNSQEDGSSLAMNPTLRYERKSQGGHRFQDLQTMDCLRALSQVSSYNRKTQQVIRLEDSATPSASENTKNRSGSMHAKVVVADGDKQRCYSTKNKAITEAPVPACKPPPAAPPPSPRSLKTSPSNDSSPPAFAIRRKPPRSTAAAAPRMKGGRSSSNERKNTLPPRGQSPVSNDVQPKKQQEHPPSRLIGHGGDQSGSPGGAIYHCRVPRELLQNSRLTRIIELCEDHVRHLSHGWETNLYSLTAQDVVISHIPGAMEWAQPLTDFVMERVQALYYSSTTKIVMDGNQPHVLKYDAEHHKGVELHRDRCSVTAQLALSCPTQDFGGGGTYFKNIFQQPKRGFSARKHSAEDITVRLRKGELLLHPGNQLHAGVELTNGMRYVMIWFCQVEA